MFAVRPTKVELSGVKHHTVQGTNIHLICQVSLILIFNYVFRGVNNKPETKTKKLDKFSLFRDTIFTYQLLMVIA